MFVVTITKDDGYTYAARVSPQTLDRFLGECLDVTNPRYEGITIMAAHLYDDVDVNAFGESPGSFEDVH